MLLTVVGGALMGKLLLIGLLPFYLLATPFPTTNFKYGTLVYISNLSGNENLKEVLLSDTYYACRTIHRALYAIENYYEKIVGFYPNGVNFSVLFSNYNFYHKRLTSRFNICINGNIYLKLAGSGGFCNSENGTDAYVKITLGFIHNTINICDLYFTADDSRRISVLTHEFGRLEGIGDSQNFDTNNIYVWDNILYGLDTNFELLSNE